MEEQAEDAGCEDAFDEYMTCVEDEGDVCDGVPPCVSKGNEYMTCIGKYCGSHPSDELCRAYD